MSLVLDTHAAVWYALGSGRLSATARQRIDAAIKADHVYFSAVTLVEIIYLVEKDRLPREALDRLLTLVRQPASSVRVAPLDVSVSEALMQVSRDKVPDMPDRIIAATALHLGLPLVTRDHKIRLSGVETIW